ncbi:MAG TPA: MFS transporter [Anaeromyxobacteraceae bacterium]|nr:MFS transporter [Anaeromyxobacteraceae bacterium]
MNDVAATPARSPWIGFSAVSVGTFMATLDGSIVNVALPTITRELHASLAGVEWIVAAYLLVISTALLTAGRLGDLFGHRLVYAGGLLVFTVGSGLCGFAPGLAPLVGARAVQALGACAMMAMGPAIVTSIFPAPHRGRALGMVASVVALGLTAGPPLGGFIVQHLSWRWIFFVNLPVGAAGVTWARRVLPRDRPARAAPLDRRGALMQAATLAAGVAAIQAVPESAGRAAALMLVALAMGVLLVRHLRRAPAPVIDLALFRSRVFSAGIASGLLSYAALFSSTFLTPFFLTRVRGLDADALGAMLISVPLALSVVSPVAGWLSDRFGPRALGPLGMVVLAAGLVLVGLADQSTPSAAIALPLGLCGAGMGLFQSPNNSAVMGTLPRTQLGSGGGMLATARNLGMVVGVSVASALFRARAGEVAGPPERFLGGYRAALFTGAALALAASVVALARDGRRPARI